MNPTVIYTHPTEESGLQHQIFVFKTNDSNHNHSHNSKSVVNFIKEIVKDVKSLDPGIKCIHYWHRLQSDITVKEDNILPSGKSPRNVE